MNNERGKEDLELPLFDLEAISNATENFSQQNKLGQGGFGTVYKVSPEQRKLHPELLKKVVYLHNKI